MHVIVSLSEYALNAILWLIVGMLTVLLYDMLERRYQKLKERYKNG